MRLEIFRFLSTSGELSAGDLAQALGWPRNKLSHHVAEMVRSGALETTARGRQRFFRVADPKTAREPTHRPPLSRFRIYFTTEWKPGVPERAPDLTAESATELMALTPGDSGLTIEQVAIVRAVAVGLAQLKRGGDAVIDLPAGIFKTFARVEC